MKGGNTGVAKTVKEKLGMTEKKEEKEEGEEEEEEEAEELKEE